MSENRKIILDNITCPMILFGHDLRKAIEKYISQGRQIIVCGDFNSEYDGLTEWFLSGGLQIII